MILLLKHIFLGIVVGFMGGLFSELGGEFSLSLFCILYLISLIFLQTFKYI